MVWVQSVGLGKRYPSTSWPSPGRCTNARRAAQRLRDMEIDAVIAPALPYGVTDFAAGFSGAISIPEPVLVNFIVAGVEAYLTDGFHHVCLINHHLETGQRLAAERAFLKELDGSCETPIAGLSILNGAELFLRGEVLRPDGTEKLAGKRRGAISDAVEMGHDLARELLSQAGTEFFTWR